MRLDPTGATRTALGAVAALLALGLAAPANAAGDTDVAPPTSPVTIDPVTANGSGCPNAEARVIVAPDNSGFTVRHTNFFAHAGLGASPLDFRRNCQVNLQVNVPDGFTYAIARGVRSGFLHLPEGGTALQRTSYYFAGISQTTIRDHQFAGPVNERWRTVDEISEADLVFAPCDAKRNLNINTELRVRTPDPASSVSFMLLGRDRAAVSRYTFAWKQC